jgi:hypothetical protein
MTKVVSRMWKLKQVVLEDRRLLHTSLVRARSLDVTRLLALVADALTGCLRRTISREMTNFAA